MLNQFDSGNQR